jgi:hypothetical protein
MLKRLYQTAGLGSVSHSTRKEPDNAEDLLPTAELSIESSLAKELTQLSLQEREKAYYDLHGVADAVQETPAFVTNRLADLEMELGKTKNKKAYELAKSQDEDYICGREFRLPFLRAETFDSKKAATRLVGFLEEKLRLFGLKPLARELILSDLNQDDRSVLDLGFCSLAPLRDSAGRAVISFMPYFRGTSTVQNRLRAIMYIHCTIARDEEIQKKGAVAIFISKAPYLGGNCPIAEKTWSVANQVYNIVPLRYVGTHFCYDQGTKNRMVMNLHVIFVSARSSARVRFRFHSKSFTETHYTLMTFGIPTHVLPMNSYGEAVWKHHHEWLRMREELEAKKEEQQPSVATSNIHDPSTDGPMPLDVMMGNEKRAQNHPGNTPYQYLISENQKRYDSADSRIEKTLIASEIVMAVKEYGGHFWMRKQGVSGWVVMEDWVAREKVATAFRGRRRSAIARASKRTSGERGLQDSHAQMTNNKRCLGVTRIPEKVIYKF